MSINPKHEHYSTEPGKYVDFEKLVETLGKAVDAEFPGIPIGVELAEKEGDDGIFGIHNNSDLADETIAVFVGNFLAKAPFIDSFWLTDADDIEAEAEACRVIKEIQDEEEDDDDLDDEE